MGSQKPDLPGIRISLVTGSLLRPPLLQRLADSLVSQSHQNFDWTIVEQRDHSGAVELLRNAHLDPLIIASRRGLSRARNVGLTYVTGDVVGFPDDDCWYDPDTLRRVAEQFSADPSLDVLCAGVQTSSGPMLKYPRKSCTLSKRNVWRTAVSPGVFVRTSAIRKIGNFNERLGVGSGTLAGSAEETEYVLRGLALGMNGKFEPQVRVFHPSPEDVANRLSPDLGYSYGYGMGWVLKSHEYSILSRYSAVGRPLVGSVVAAIRGDGHLARFRRSVARGRRDGLGSTP